MPGDGQSRGVPRARRSTQRSEAQRSGATPNRGLAPMLAWTSAAARPRICGAADREERSTALAVRGTKEVIGRLWNHSPNWTKFPIAGKVSTPVPASQIHSEAGVESSLMPAKRS